MKKLIAVLWILAFPAFAANYASPTFNNITTTGNITSNSGKIIAVVPTDASLKALPLTGFSAGTVVQDTGYHVDGDMPSVEYTLQTSACSLNSGAGDGGSQVASNTPNNCWILSKSKIWDVRNFGAYCNYNVFNGTGTVDTTAIQSAINAAQTVPLAGNGTPNMQLHLPPSCLTGPLTLTRPIVMVGDGEMLSHLRLVNGSTSPLFTIALAYDNGNYYATGEQPATVIIKNMALDGPGIGDSGGANGIQLQTAGTNPIYGRIILQNLRVDYFAGNNIDGTGFGANGYAQLEDVSDYAAGNIGLNLNSNFDWVITNSNFYGSVTNNVRLSGVGGIKFSASSSWSAGGNNVQIFDGTSGTNEAGVVSWTGGSIDHAAGYNVYYDARGQNVPYIFTGVGFGDAGSGTPGTYSDIYVTNQANKSLSLNGVMFFAPHSIVSANSSLWNVQFQGTTQLVTTSNVNIQATPAQSYSNPYQLIGASWNGAGTAPIETHTGGFLNAAGNVGGYSGTLTQGPSLGWNYSYGTGESDLFLGQGNGSTGGLWVYPVNSAGTIGSRIFALSPTGNIQTNGTIFSGPQTITSSTQYTGFIISNGTNNIASINGNSASNDVGVLDLFSAGTPNVQLSSNPAYATSFINNTLTMGNGSESASPSTGILQGTSGSGTNTTGADLIIRGGQGTGSATSGGVEIQAAPAGTSGSSANALGNYFRVDSAGATIQNGALVFKTTPYTVATLPTCNSTTAWYIYPVSDASSPTWNGTLSGGGSTKVLALCNGSNWTAH